MCVVFAGGLVWQIIINIIRVFVLITMIYTSGLCMQHFDQLSVNYIVSIYHEFFALVIAFSNIYLLFHIHIV